MKIGLITVLALLAASPATAQPAPTWTVTRTPTGVAAETALSDGIQMKARCEAGTLYLLLVDGGRLRDLPISERGPDNDSRSPIGEWVRWEAAGPLLSRNPAISIRALLTLPEYRVRFRTRLPTDKPIPVRAPLPADDGPLRSVLQTCGEPLHSDRDIAPPEVRARMLSLRPDEFPDIRRRTPEFPERALALNVPRGEAHVSCVMQGAGVRDCRVEIEFPAGVGFGEAALTAMARSTVSNGIDGGIFIMTVRFALAD